MDKLKNVI